MIELKNITVAYSQKAPVLENLSLQIANDELLIILGKSGSGKTTLLKLLNGLLPPQTGECFLKGQSIYQLSEAKRKQLCAQTIGFVWQDYRLIPELTVMNNILLPSLIQNVKVDNNYFDQLADLLGISNYLQNYPKQLSGGEQQRVALARALILKPQIVIADEPTGALDSITASLIINLFLKTHQELGTILIIATHDNELAAIGKRKIELQDGQVVLDVKQS